VGTTPDNIGLNAKARPEGLGELGGDVMIGTQGQLDPLGTSCAIDGKAGAIGSPITHHCQHASRERSELGRQRFILEKKSNDPAHQQPPSGWFQK